MDRANSEQVPPVYGWEMLLWKLLLMKFDPSLVLLLALEKI
jgi:hypothetical protein